MTIKSYIIELNIYFFLIYLNHRQIFFVVNSIHNDDHLFLVFMFDPFFFVTFKYKKMKISFPMTIE
ncbi:hypothetical protein DERF_014993 [Dermatophagoides farinae]|uniref:Uncharacterized protein n=1 Tax=Dermatophagoides farinae TaxID=6954 RepID=A0A922HNC5_DERFA|nr:hypothetical protein DERF_014993 [Dermatophagoides farinae]